ncbi:hypothetical protein OYT88_20460 [Sporolactobacillus sp. CQH2019]|jgi:low temperature requirement protein LtrA|uniref:hypothetical protein n=1 Tax=Sporolactobacillus sp. CQH2019 TaxID=3023512 RepID=UPI002368E954|nr:hypothetical protein [Sporolactobacillus sp. CQH2019]MBE6087906.1 hypothetical protein [Clostridium beijerinckii]MDD9150894.1 hypothetical protein [Sporolactobacillus sp. CQH2019]
MKIYNFLGNLGTLILLILNIKGLFGKSIASGIGPNAEYNYFMFFIIYGILSFILIIAYLCKKREDSQQALLLFSIITILFSTLFLKFILNEDLFLSFFIFSGPICLMNIHSITKFTISKKKN